MPLPGQPGRVDEEYCWPPGIRIVTREASAGAYPYQYGGPWIAVTTLSGALLTGSWGSWQLTIARYGLIRWRLRGWDCSDLRSPPRQMAARRQYEQTCSSSSNSSSVAYLYGL
jgi:hypothetical protein